MSNGAAKKYERTARVMAEIMGTPIKSTTRRQRNRMRRRARGENVAPEKIGVR